MALNSVESPTPFGIDPQRLLAGPRGRRVCWALLAREGSWWWRERAPESAGPIRLAEELSALVARADLEAISSSRDPGVLLGRAGGLGVCRAVLGGTRCV